MSLSPAAGTIGNGTDEKVIFVYRMCITGKRQRFPCRKLRIRLAVLSGAYLAHRVTVLASGSDDAFKGVMGCPTKSTAESRLKSLQKVVLYPLPLDQMDVIHFPRSMLCNG